MSADCSGFRILAGSQPENKYTWQIWDFQDVRSGLDGFPSAEGSPVECTVLLYLFLSFGNQHGEDLGNAVIFKIPGIMLDTYKTMKRLPALNLTMLSVK